MITDPSEIRTNVSTLKMLLKEELQREMRLNPKAFALEVLEDTDYPDQFANHMVKKLTLKRVLFVNETVRGVMESLNLNLRKDGIDSLYNFIGLDGPNADKNLSRYDELYPPRQFRGC